jgi:hypothetical protein
MRNFLEEREASHAVATKFGLDVYIVDNMRGEDERLPKPVNITF